jgi:hypothetical protein
MTSEELHKAHSQRPFNPFTMHLSDGSFNDVPTPEFLAYKPGNRYCLVLHVRGPGHTAVALSHVTRITFEEAALAPDTSE